VLLEHLFQNPQIDVRFAMRSSPAAGLLRVGTVLVLVIPLDPLAEVEKRPAESLEAAEVGVRETARQQPTDPMRRLDQGDLMPVPGRTDRRCNSSRGRSVDGDIGLFNGSKLFRTRFSGEPGERTQESRGEHSQDKQSPEPSDRWIRHDDVSFRENEGTDAPGKGFAEGHCFAHSDCPS
jgi:hypothetical protein